jgi:hypothetical protein
MKRVPPGYCGNVLDPAVRGAERRQTADLAWTLALVAVLWLASDAGYFYLLPTLGLKGSYSASSIPIAVYYAVWVVIAVAIFWRVYRIWWTAYENRLSSYVLFSLTFAALTLFPGYALPLLPPINWAEPWTPPEIVFATPWYFLPKSVEILFQQLLVLAMVVAFSGRQLALSTISVSCALLFGAIHILVALEDVPLGYAVRLVVVGSAFGLVFPYLILRMRNGLAYAYIAHWSYYAITALAPHVFYVPGAATGPG